MLSGTVLPLDDLLGADADAASGHHQFPGLVAILDNRFLEREFTRALALFCPGVARARSSVQHVAGLGMTVILEVLLGMQDVSRPTRA